jgi:hypothetical protein
LLALVWSFLFMTAPAALTLAQSGSPARNPQTRAGTSIVITHVTIIDTETGKEVPDRTVVITDERITDIQAGRVAKLSSAARVVDGRGKYLIPGLWDMHVHTLARERRDTYFPLFLANGITGVRDMGAWISLLEIREWRQQMASGTLVGPRIIGVAGPLVDGPGGKHIHTGFPTDTGGVVAVSTADEGREAVANLQQQGVDFIKVYNQLPRDAFFAIADEAKRRRIAFTGHVPVSVTISEASKAGQRSMEHLDAAVLECAEASRPTLREELTSATDSPPKELQAALDACDPTRMTALFSLLAKNDTWQEPTLVQLLFTAAANPEQDPRLRYVIHPIRAEWEAMLVGFRTNPQLLHRIFLLKLQMVRAMHAEGVRFLAGTDTPSFPGTIAGFALHDELQLLVKAGLTPAEALKAATWDAAEFMGKQGDFGSVTKGKMADLVLLASNPLADIRNTTHILEVFLNGKEFDRAMLDSLLNKAQMSAN